ncbi:MAG: hypothetical protein JSS45_03220 [Proteobacteria bacterium]|nr:hypothetical protein [Pseudomonadota bacterium]
MPATDRKLLLVLALELRPGEHAGRDALDPAQAARLAAGIAEDLAKLAPAAAHCDLAVLGAHYDSIELLRPGWPVHAALDSLAQRAPMAAAGDGGARILAFGAHAGALPEAVPSPDADYAQGAMRLLPLLLRARGDDAPALAEVVAEFEHILLERGMAGAATALFAQDAFAAPIEHARYLTVHDLTAMMAMQYEHAGLGPLWPLIETALLAAHEETWLDAPPEPLARYGDGEVRIALLDADAWRAGGFAPPSAGTDAAKLERAFERFEARQRQFAAVLAAHGIAVTFVHCPQGGELRDSMQS